MEEKLEYLNQMKPLLSTETSKKFKVFISKYFHVVKFFGGLREQIEDIGDELDSYDFETLEIQYTPILDKAQALYNDIDFLEPRIKNNPAMQEFIEMAQIKTNSSNLEIIIKTFNERKDEIQNNYQMVENGKRFVRDNGKEIVIDKKTSLMWQDDIDCKTEIMSWNNAIKYAENLSLYGYSDWRLPTIEELKTIIDTDLHPTIREEFHNVAPNTYWSSSEHTSFIYYSCHIHFYSGLTSYSHKSNEYYVRCIRG